MEELSFKETFRFLNRHKKALIITFLASAIVAAGISLLLPNYYKSEVTLLPSDTNSISKGVLSQMDNVDPFNFGTASDCEYILDIITSGRIIGAACNKFNLAEHYGITAQGNELEEKLGRKLYNNIKVKRTENLGVRLTVWDTDPEYAANIANFIVREVSVVRNAMKKEKADSIVNAIDRSRKMILADIDLLSDSLSKLSQENNLYFPDGASERFAQELAKQVAAGNNAAVARLEAKMKSIEAAGAKVANLRDQLINRRESLRMWTDQLEKAKVDRDAEIPAEFIIEYASPSFSKDKPKRSIIVAVTALACTFLALCVLVVRDRRKSE